MRPVIREAAERIEQLQQLDPVGERVKALVDRYVPVGSDLKDALSGTWLGHPLHPLLTDVVIGTWTSSFLLDLIPSRRARAASDRLIAAGILAALPTAAAGLSDWSDVWGGSRRVGLVHAAANLVSLSLYTSSWLSRKCGRRLRGRWLSATGFGAATFSAYLGGHLTFGKGVGVDQTAFEEGPRDWQAVAAEATLGEGELTPATVDGVGLLLVRRGATVHAISDRCSHRGCSLHQGHLTDDAVVCPCHGSTFRLANGEVLHGPATAPQPAYETRVRDGNVEVRLASS